MGFEHYAPIFMLSQISFGWGSLSGVWESTIWFFSNSSVIGWTTILAEVAVAGVIYMELEQSRVAGFLSEAFRPEALKERTEVYKRFLNEPGSLQEKRQRFHEKLCADPLLRQQCDEQITHLSTLANVAMAGWSFVARRRLIQWFPHVAAFMWVMCGTHIRERQRDTGEWWARDLIKFTAKCISFMQKTGETITMKAWTADSELSIPVVLKDLKTELDG